MWVVSQWGALAKPWGAFAIRDGGSGELLQSHGAFAIRDGGALTSPIGKHTIAIAVMQHTNTQMHASKSIPSYLSAAGGPQSEVISRRCQSRGEAPGEGCRLPQSPLASRGGCAPCDPPATPGAAPPGHPANLGGCTPWAPLLPHPIPGGGR